MMRVLSKYWPIAILILFFTLLFREVIFQEAVLVPADTLVGTFFPWIDYKWGYSVGVPVKNPLLSDAYSEFFIHKHLVADLVKQGVAPLWNRFILAGTPLLATYHTNPFFPANFLLLLPKFLGWNIFIISSHLAALLSMYFYLGFRQTNKAIRLIAGIVYAFFGPMTTWSEFGTAVWAATILPLILLTLDHYFLKHNRRLLPLFSLLVSLLIFAGQLQLVIYSAIITFFYTIYLFFQAKTISYRPLLILASFGLLGLGISAIQLLPTYDLLGRSIRSGENYASYFNYGLIAFPQLIRLIAADFFGHPGTYNFWSSFEYHEFSGFLGTLSLPLLLPLFIRKSSTYRRFFLFTFAISILLVTFHPVSRFIFSLPLPLLTFSYASRLYFVTGFATAILVSESLSHLTSANRRLYLLSGLIILGLLGLGLTLAPRPQLTVALRNSVLPSALILTFMFFLFFRLPKKIILVSLLVLFSFDLSRYYRKYNPAINLPLVFPSTPALDFVRNQPGIFRIAREKTNLLPPNTWAYYGLESVEGYEPLRPLNYGQLFHLLENGRYFNRTVRFSELEDVSPKFLSALNVKYFFIVNKKDPTEIQQKLFNSGYKTVFIDKSVSILENPNVLPRAFFVSEVITVSSEQELANQLESPDFNPSRTAIIPGNTTGQTFTFQTPPHISQYSDNRLIIQTSETTPQFMVISNSYDPGWKLTIDGQTSRTIRTNGALTGIPLSEGEHTLILTYQPDSFVAGTKLTLFSLSLLILLSAIILSKKQNETKS